jgi:murein DD-endopeptidase MepM/ murein hydrolase activator NlpD
MLETTPIEPAGLPSPEGEVSVDEGSNPSLLSGILISSAHASTKSSLSMEEFEAEVMRRLALVEAEQNRLAANLAGLAETKLVEFDDMLAPFKMKAVDLANATDFEFMGQGGPFVPVGAEGFSAIKSGDFELDLPFPGLSQKWGEMLKVYEGMKSLPLLTPAENYYVSSLFGRRTDPLTKARARHYGMDLAGWPGEKIFTTGDGVVVKAGTWGAYGRMVEIDHGNGFTTRYGHMKKVLVTRGQTVKAGDIIGQMGCTGRCTSTHLHYEVMFNGTNRNPQPFMEAPEDVQQTQRQANSNPDEGR